MTESPIQSHVNHLNTHFCSLHTGKEDAFWRSYMGLETDSQASRDELDKRETLLKAWLQDPARIHEINDLQEMCSGDSNDDTSIALEGWLKTFKANSIESAEGRELARDHRTRGALARARSGITRLCGWIRWIQSLSSVRLDVDDQSEEPSGKVHGTDSIDRVVRGKRFRQPGEAGTGWVNARWGGLLIESPACREHDQAADLRGSTSWSDSPESSRKDSPVSIPRRAPWNIRFETGTSRDSVIPGFLSRTAFADGAEASRDLASHTTVRPWSSICLIEKASMKMDSCMVPRSAGSTERSVIRRESTSQPTRSPEWQEPAKGRWRPCFTKVGTRPISPMSICRLRASVRNSHPPRLHSLKSNPCSWIA